MKPKDYKNRTYLSTVEAAKYLDMSVKILHSLVKKGIIKFQIAASGQMRFDSKELKEYEKNILFRNKRTIKVEIEKINIIEINETVQKIFVKDSTVMSTL
jgi:hypothetical protein